MVVLDTDHVSELIRESRIGLRLRERIIASGADTFTSIITVEEGHRGWMARLHAVQNVAEQVWLYEQLDVLIAFFADNDRLPWTAESASRFTSLRKQGIRIGTMDLKIACITLEYDATLLTRNTGDFAKVPGLRVENWLD